MAYEYADLINCEGSYNMKTRFILIGIIMFSVINVFAADNNLKKLYDDVKKTVNIENEGDLKGFYKNVTTAINTALLTKAGSFEISGSMSYNTYHTEFISGEEIDQSTIQLDPNLSYFIIDNLSLGLQVTYLNQKTEYEPSNLSQTINQTYIGPVIK